MSNLKDKINEALSLWEDEELEKIWENTKKYSTYGSPYFEIRDMIGNHQNFAISNVQRVQQALQNQPEDAVLKSTDFKDVVSDMNSFVSKVIGPKNDIATYIPPLDDANYEAVKVQTVNFLDAHLSKMTTLAKELFNLRLQQHMPGSSHRSIS